MLIGVDFDNTVVCYDQIFHRVCLERELIPPETPVNKSDVRNFLRAAGREDRWTEMQGYVYGERLLEAEPFPGVLDFFRDCRRAGIDVCIVSHKTRHPFLGHPYDLHRAAAAWLESRGFHDPEDIGLERNRVHLELTKAEKLGRIAANGCTHFIDDLPEFLGDAEFPAGVERLLFDPNGLYLDECRFDRVDSWLQLRGRFFE